MRAIHHTRKSDVVSDVLQPLLAFLSFVGGNISNEMFHHDLLSFAMAITVIYFHVAQEVKNFDNHVFL